MPSIVSPLSQSECAEWIRQLMGLGDVFQKLYINMAEAAKS